MEENVALESSKQKKFVKSIKGIKKLIKKNEKEVKDDTVKKPENAKRAARKRPERGLVYLSHIPHGFYEHEMTQYFKQFGMVTNVRVIRSKRTGNSKGHAFVEFKEPAVGQIVAETMNNYLMGKRLIKAAYIPPEKQRKAMRKRWSRLNNPGRDAKLKFKKSYNENKDETGDLKRARKIISNLKKNKSKLAEMGINYDFFAPVDVPEALMPLLENKETDTKVKAQNVEKDTKVKAQNLEKDKKVKVDKVPETKNIKKEKVKTEPVKKQNKLEVNTKVEPVKKENKLEVNKKDQKEKQQKLKEAGVKHMGNFVKINQETDEESDSSADFDSDEYEKMLEGEDSDIDSGDSDGDDNEVSDDDDDNEEVSDDEDEGDENEEMSDESESESEEEEEIAPPVKKGKGKKGPIIAQPPQIKTSDNKNKQKQVQEKRKVPQRAVNTKKSNFEKQTQQPMKKQFKKKK